jgi:hypothetical protein
MVQPLPDPRLLKLMEALDTERARNKQLEQRLRYRTTMLAKLTEKVKTQDAQKRRDMHVGTGC